VADLDIIIPVYNEGENIVPVLESLRAAVKTPFRVWICYDRDDDNTLVALNQYRDAPFEIILVKNRGRGAHGAVLSGFAASTAPCVLVFPADDTYNGPMIDRMVERMRDGCEIVAASRFMRGGLMHGCPWIKALLVRTAASTLYHFAGIQTRDATNGFRMFSRKVLDSIEIESSQGFTYSLELLAKCHRLGWKIGEVPVSWYERTRGTSRFRVFRWARAYLKWYLYAFSTTWFRRGSGTVTLRRQSHGGSGQARDRTSVEGHHSRV
jgi:dolichol-phosphate mannosyltransferase